MHNTKQMMRIGIALSFVVCFCHCKEEVTTIEDVYEQMVVQNKCIAIYPPLCPYTFQKKLVDNPQSHQVLKELWTQFDIYLKKQQTQDQQEEDSQTDNKTIIYVGYSNLHKMLKDFGFSDEKIKNSKLAQRKTYAVEKFWGQVGYIRSLCDIIKAYPHTTTSLTALVELLDIYEYKHPIPYMYDNSRSFCNICQQSKCNGHADQDSQTINQVKQKIKTLYPQSWQALYLVSKDLREKMSIYNSVKKDLVTEKDLQLETFRQFDKKPPQEFLDYRKHFIDGFTSTKTDLKPSLGAPLYMRYARILKYWDEEKRVNIYWEMRKYYDDYYSEKGKERKYRY